MPSFPEDKARGHAILPDKLAAAFPEWRSTDGVGLSAIVVARFFGPGHFTYYATEFDGEDTFFGYLIPMLDPNDGEWSYFDLPTLATTGNPHLRGHPAFERDLYFNDGLTVLEALTADGFKPRFYDSQEES